MEFSYGQGVYIQGNRKLEGQIILGEHKLYLRNSAEDLALTYVPLEKIERIRKTKLGIEVHACLSISNRYVVLLRGEKKYLSDLVRDIAQRRGLKKRFLKKEWVEIKY